MGKKLARFAVVFSFFSHCGQASDKNFLTDLPKPVFYKVIEFLDIQSIGRMMCLSKPIGNEICGLKEQFKSKYKILDPEQIKLLETCISDFREINKEVKKSISPFAFSTRLIEETKQNEKLKYFMNEFIDTLFLEKKSILLEWQAMMIRKKILKSFFEEILKKEKKQKWSTIFERQLFANEICLEMRHSYYLLPFVFFLDQGVSVNYGIKNAIHCLGTTIIEFAAGAGFYNLVDFLLKNGARVNRHDSTESCLYLAVDAYTTISAKDKNCDDACRTILLLLDHGANKDHFIPGEGMTVREYVMENISDLEILKYF